MPSLPPSAERLPWPIRVERRLGADRTARLVDAAIAAACFACFTGPLLLGVVDRSGSIAGQALFGLLATVPLVFRRYSPVVVVLVVAVVVAVAPLLQIQFTPFVSDAGPALPIAVYTVAASRVRAVSLPVSVAAAAIATVGGVVAFLVHPGIEQDAVQLALAVVAWWAGDTTRSRREFRRRAREQELLREHERLQRVRAEEQLRLSREVHDVVSHNLSMIAVQAGAGRLLFDDRPEEARRALVTVEQSSRAALTDLRELLRDMRTTGPASSGAAPRLADLAALVTQISDDGVATATLLEAGPVRTYPAAVELSGYRIVQEAVTNVVKHAPGATVTVHVAHRPTELVLTVSDDGGLGAAADPPAGAGLGLDGIRERVDLLGGEVVAGPGPDGGFRVRARIPVAADSAGSA